MYHAGLTPDERAKKQGKLEEQPNACYSRNQRTLDMGIDKPDVRLCCT